MTDNELDQLMQRVLLDAIKRDCEKENSVVPSFEPSLRYQRSLAAMIADPLKWAHKRAKPLWKNILQKVAVVLIIFSLSLGSLMVVSPNIRAAVVNWVTEWYETHITYAPSSGWPLSLSTLRMMMAERGVFSKVSTLLSPPEMKHSCVAGSLME